MATLTAQGIVDVGINLLTRSLVLPRTATNVPAGAFDGPNGGTVTVPVPVPGLAREQSTPGADIDFDDANEVPVEVSLKHFYSGRLVPDEVMDWTVANFARQYTRVQVAAVAEAAEDQIADVMNDLSADDSVTDEDDVLDGILAARQFLGRNNAPTSNRWLAVSPEFATLLLGVDKITRVNEAGTSSALRNAVIGSLYGFTIVESNALDAGTAVGYHQSGFLFSNGRPGSVQGAIDSAVTAQGGISLRQVLDYASTKLSHISVLDTYAGSAAVYDATIDSSGDIDSSEVAQRFFKLDIASGSA